MKRKFPWIFAVCAASLCLIGGCQKTPEKSAVVSKIDGLDKNTITGYLKEGEYRTLDIPKHWTAEDKRSNDRAIMKVDMDMEPPRIGNLPVIEMQNHVLTVEELQKLVQFFAGEELLYEPAVDTKEDYRKIKERIEKKEGAYQEIAMRSFYQEQAGYIQKAIEIAPEKCELKQIEEIKFGRYTENPAFYIAANFEEPESNKVECFFWADVGEDRSSHIEAIQYGEEAGIASSFLWRTGEEVISEEYLQNFQERNESQIALNGKAGYYGEWQEILVCFEEKMNLDGISDEAGKMQAEKLLKDLQIMDMKLLSSERALWFPHGSIPRIGVGSSEDQLYQADLTQAEAGYQYHFCRMVEGLSINSFRKSFNVAGVEESYTPPFPVESLTIVVTESGIKLFSWNGMCEEVKWVAENTKLLSFSEVQESLFNQIYYRYAAMGQPLESDMVFTYEVKEANLGYTYVTAFENPDHAWLVPAWFFKVMEHCDGGEGLKFDRETMEFMINALDGGLISGS